MLLQRGQPALANQYCSQLLCRRPRSYTCMLLYTLDTSLTGILIRAVLGPKPVRWGSSGEDLSVMA